jgi:hypothetical protein
MSIEISRFVNPLQDSGEYKAVKKAVEDKPKVVFIGQTDEYKYYQVTSSRKLGPHYPVRTWIDRDGSSWIECFCAAAYPPKHPHTQLIAWFEKAACYHQAAVVLEESKK